MTRYGRWIGAAIGVVVLSVALQAYAAAEFSVAPFVIDHRVEPRDIVAETIVIKNIGVQPVSLYPSVHNVSIGTEGGIETFVPPSMSDRTTSLSSWIEIRRSAVELQPGESAELPLTVRVNPQAAPGTYHAFIGFAAGRNADEAEAKVMRGGTQGVVINVTIEDTRTELLRLSQFLIKKFVTSSNQGDITYTVQNTGDIDLVPHGDVILYNQRGEEVGAVAVNPDGQAVPPGESATFTADVPTDGLLGKYKALLSLQYGTTQTASLNDTVFFYVLPWKKILIAFSIVALIAVLLSLTMHRRYLDEDDDESDRVPVAVRGSVSTARAHDLDMKQQ